MNYKDLIDKDKNAASKLDAISEQLTILYIVLEELDFNSDEAKEVFAAIGRLMYMASGRMIE